MSNEIFWGTTLLALLAGGALGAAFGPMGLRWRGRLPAAAPHTVLDNITDGFITLDQKWRLSYVNRRAAEIFSRAPDQLLGRVLWYALPGAFDAPFREACERARRERRAVDVTVRHGAWDLSLDYHIDPGETDLAIYIRDVSDTSRVERERQRIERRMGDLLSSIPDGFIVIDPHLRCSYVSAKAAELFGRAADALLGQPLPDLFPEMEGTTFHESCVRSLREGTATRVETDFPTGRRYRNHIYPTSEGIAVFFEDLTVEQQLHARIAADEAWLRATFEQSSVGIVHSSIDGRLLRVNQRFCEIVGRTLDNVLLQPLHELTHPDDRRPEAHYLDMLRARTRTSYHREKRYLRPNGEIVWAAVHVSLVEQDQDRDPFVLAIVIDVTARKQAEQLLESARLRLSRFTVTLTQAMEVERRRISREIHDEFGQAFTALRMDLAWLDRRLYDIESPRTRPLHEHLASMTAFIDQTVASVRRIAAELRPVVLDQLGLVPALRTLAEEFTARTEIVCDLNLETVPLTGEEASQLFRIAQEALTNVTRHARATRVSLTLAGAAGDVQLMVEDDGIGFEVSSATRADATHGLLGITERAALLNGRAEIVSAPGHGTRVTVTVPFESGRTIPA